MSEFVIKDPPLARGEYAIVLAEVATGILLLPDGQRRLGDAGPYHIVFPSLDRAEEFAHRLLDRNPEWEAHVYDADKKWLKRLSRRD